MSDIPKCGWCGFLAGLLRRAMCVGRHRGSNESYYRELSEQDTLRIDRRSSESTVSNETDDVLAGGYEQKTFEEEVEDMFKAGATLTESDKKPIGNFHSYKRKPREISVNPLKNAILDDYYPMKVQLLLSRISTWEFDTHDLEKATGGRILSVLGMHLFIDYGLIDSFKLHPEKCLKLFHIIEENYHADNLYHNAVHAADVIQAVHCFLKQPMLSNYVTDLEVMVVLLAAITHDLDHPGVNHSFLVATNHPLAIMYKEKNLGANDRSPRPVVKRRRGRRYMEMLRELKAARQEYTGLESSPIKSKASSSSSIRNIKIDESADEQLAPPPCESILEHHHWRVAYSCILESGIFDHMQEDLPEIKEMLKSLILATDITRQQEYLDKFKRLLSKKTFDMRRADHRHMVLQMALKTADISNPGRPWKISKKWSHKVCSEFYAQGDTEKDLNLTVSYLCNRDTDTIPKIQSGFFRFIVTPLFNEWHRYLKSLLSRKMLTNLIFNESEWVREENRSNPTSLACEPEISDADLVEKDLETGTNFSGSSEILVLRSGSLGFGSSGLGSTSRMPRRSSFSPLQNKAIKDAIRRYSAPIQLYYGRKKSILSEHGFPDAQTSPAHSAKGQCYSQEEFASGCRLDAGSSSLLVKKDLIDLGSPPRRLMAFYEVDSADIKQKGVEIDSVIVEETSTSSGSQVVSSNGANGASHYFLVPSEPERTASAPTFQIQLDHQIEEERHDVLPQLFGDLYHRRRGSAPTPLAVPDLKGLASTLSLQLEAQLKMRRASANQWMSDDAPARGPARRGSLPAEVTPSAWIPA